jgi:Flp pilus assembly protein TadG
MIALMGFCALAVDYGTMVADANQLQRACDSAALGGAGKLPNESEASTLASTVATQNQVGPNANASGSVVDTLQISFLENSSKIQVEATRSRTYLFAPIFNLLGGGINYTNGTVTRRAVASGRVGVNPRPVPIGITMSTYLAYTQPTVTSAPVDLSFLRATDTAYGHVGPPADGMVVYDMRTQSSKSPAAMSDQIKDGATPVIGEYYTVLNSSTTGSDTKFTGALDTVFARSAQAPWFDSSTVGVK